jgi:uncharacterized membrane protein
MTELDITTSTKPSDDDEYKLEVNGFRCPEEFARQFTPLEFEEVKT